MHGRIDVHLNQPHLPAAVSEGRREGGREGEREGGREGLTLSCASSIKSNPRRSKKPIL